MWLQSVKIVWAWFVFNALIDGAQVGNVAVGVEDFGTSVAAHEVTTIHADGAPIVVGVGVVLWVHVGIFCERFRWDREHGQCFVGAYWNNQWNLEIAKDYG